MKEQDAAHSFTEGSEVPENKSIIQFLLGANSYDGYWWNDSPQIHGRAPFWWRKKLREEFESKDAELTRLRSELQHKNEVIKKMLPLAHRAKSGLWANDPYCGYVDETLEMAKESLKKQS